MGCDFSKPCRLGEVDGNNEVNLKREDKDKEIQDRKTCFYKPQPGVDLAKLDEVYKSCKEYIETLLALKGDPHCDESGKLIKCIKVLEKISTTIIDSISDDLVTIEYTSKPSEGNLRRIKAVVLSRLSTFLINFGKCQTVELKDVNIIIATFGLMDMTDANDLLYQSFLFNISRAFIDLEVFKNLDDLFQQLSSRPQKFSIDPSQGALFKEVWSFYYRVVTKSKLFISALEVIFQMYKLGFDIKVESVVKLFRNMEVKWAKETRWWGMVAYDNTVFLSKDIFTHMEFLTDAQKKAKILQTLLHEGMHLALRALTNNFAAQTPCEGIEDAEMLEGGYKLEHCLWGKYNVKVYHLDYCEKVLDAKSWDSEKAIFEGVANLHLRHIVNPHCSGLELKDKCSSIKTAEM
jgi:hypothetical protein